LASRSPELLQAVVLTARVILPSEHEWQRCVVIRVVHCVERGNEQLVTVLTLVFLSPQLVIGGGYVASHTCSTHFPLPMNPSMRCWALWAWLITWSGEHCCGVFAGTRSTVCLKRPRCSCCQIRFRYALLPHCLRHGARRTRSSTLSVVCARATQCWFVPMLPLVVPRGFYPVLLNLRLSCGMPRTPCAMCNVCLAQIHAAGSGVGTAATQVGCSWCAGRRGWLPVVGLSGVGVLCSSFLLVVCLTSAACGRLFIQLAIKAGARVIATAGSAEKLATAKRCVRVLDDLPLPRMPFAHPLPLRCLFLFVVLLAYICCRLGAFAGFNRHEGSWVNGVNEATEGKGVTLILDCVGALFVCMRCSCVALCCLFTQKCVSIVCGFAFVASPLPSLRMDRIHSCVRWEVL